MTDLQSLLERVEKAEGASSELDEAVALALCDEHRFAQLAGATDGVGCMMYRYGHHAFHSALRVTASLDAALALVERVLPGWAVDITRFSRTGLGRARLWQNYDGLREYCCDRAATPALALLAAMLKALISQATVSIGGEGKQRLSSSRGLPDHLSASPSGSGSQHGDAE